VRNPLKNNKGFSYVLTCVCILVVMMLVAVALQYAFVYHVAREQQNETQLKLDSYVTRYAVSKYDALKQGEPWDDYIDRNDLVDGAYTLLGFSQSGGGECFEMEGCIVYKPTIEATAGESFGVSVDYTIVIPLELFNRNIVEITVPIRLISQFRLK
jgi:hypothetical protein